MDDVIVFPDLQALLSANAKKRIATQDPDYRDAVNTLRSMVANGDTENDLILLCVGNQALATVFDKVLEKAAEHNVSYVSIGNGYICAIGPSTGLPPAMLITKALGIIDESRHCFGEVAPVVNVVPSTKRGTYNVATGERVAGPAPINVSRHKMSARRQIERPVIDGGWRDTLLATGTAP